MLRVWRPSGQELAAVSVEEIKDSVALKEHLRDQHGFPVSLQQLLHDGNVLDDGAKLAASADLQLVLISDLSESKNAARLAAAELADN
ncbi:ANKRD50, partial [Symbiodinium sp. CCMP2456]